MLPSPSSSPRVVFASRTNTIDAPTKTVSLPYLPTPAGDSRYKRPSIAKDSKPLKRLKFDRDDSSESEENDLESDDDVIMEDPRITFCRERRRTPFQLHSLLLTNPSICRRQTPSTFAILQSFVSSHKADMFKCQSIGEDTYLTPPYTCHYSNMSDAKAGGVPLLAVGTEQGTVHILNTSRRKDWDFEPPRTTIQPHNNAIFDVRWSTDDSLVATCSGDQSTRISCPKSSTITHVLRGHTSTVKCMAWDPTNTSLLATGGRDGAICLWDLRVGKRHQNGDIMASSPVMTIHGAHEDTLDKSKPKARRGKQNPAPRSITNTLYPDSEPFSLISSSSFDGIIRSWDLRQPSTPKKKSSKPQIPQELHSSLLDPTTLHGSRRPRGIISMAPGKGPSAGLLFAIGADSRVHTYNLSTLSPQTTSMFHDNLKVTSFYVGLSVSTCGRWLACASSGTPGSSFLFDVVNASWPCSTTQKGVELKGQAGEVGALDWAPDALATCSDDGTVRIWRPDLETHIKCREQPEERKWDWNWSM
ncbi:WD40-repeat-containing domain protein [Gymnopilus junonius]|uniref:WD40-repeat-containing domain protein n=1 Tax=Gymnopilus junonius TaxID=109634 RepID=A0A9P5NQW3_GYMJU|nr:WD40-repeat-containing domain protein [Gymnopilus junonius]